MANNKKKKKFSSKRALDENSPKKVSRGEDMYGYGEQKERANYSLTPTARDKIKQLSKHLDISESETIERIGRSWILKAIASGEIELGEDKSLI